MRAVETGMFPVLLLGGLMLLVSLSGCETNPYTGRSQFLMTSVSQEMQMGAQAYGQVKNDPKMKQSQDPREIEPVKRVAAHIIEDAALRNARLTLVLAVQQVIRNGLGILGVSAPDSM